MSTAREFITSLPDKVKKEWLEDVETVFHFDIEGETGGQFTVQIIDENMTVVEELTGEPTCVIRSTDIHFMQVMRGDLNPMMAVFSGKLKVTNPGEVMKYARLFGLG